jgi:hypothetical protein
MEMARAYGLVRSITMGAYRIQENVQWQSVKGKNAAVPIAAMTWGVPRSTL